MNTRRLYEAVAPLVANYNEMATRAVKTGDGKLYVPGYLSLQDFIRLSENPNLIQNGGNTKEPSYLSIEEGLRGHNADGSTHNGFIVLDVIGREIVTVVDRHGNPSIGPNMDIQRGLWSGYQISVNNSKGEKFELRTKMGVRGINIPVTVIFQDDDITACDNEAVIEIVSASKVIR